MSRTTRDYGAPVAAFLAENRRLLVFLVLFLCGVAGGCLVFLAAHDMLTGDLALILRVRPVEKGLAGRGRRLGFLLLFRILAAGAAVPLRSFRLRRAGDGAGAPIFRPGRRSDGGVLLRHRRGGDSFHRAVCDSPQSAGGRRAIDGMLGIPADDAAAQRAVAAVGPLRRLMADFKLYCVRFAMFLGVMLASGVVDVTMRLFFLRWIFVGACRDRAGNSRM